MEWITAVKDGNMERIKLLVEQGADKDMGGRSGCTPIYFASLHGHIEVARYLVEQGAALDKASNGGWTPLIAAVVGGHLEIVRYLLEQGADRDKANNIGNTPLHHAAYNGRSESAFGAALTLDVKKSDAVEHLRVGVVVHDAMG